VSVALAIVMAGFAAITIATPTGREEDGPCATSALDSYGLYAELADEYSGSIYVEPGEVRAFPPARVCRAYLRSQAAPAGASESDRLVAERTYPETETYGLMVAVIAAPFPIAWAWRRWRARAGRTSAA
jgi:hypothetical protein